MSQNTDNIIQDIFSRIPKTYDLINRILTLGLDVFWRQSAAKIASQDGSEKWLDVCSGTGDMAGALARMAKPRTNIVGVDFCFPMLSQAAKKPEHSRISFCVSEAGSLPFADCFFAENVAVLSLPKFKKGIIIIDARKKERNAGKNTSAKKFWINKYLTLFKKFLYQSLGMTK